MAGYQSSSDALALAATSIVPALIPAFLDSSNAAFLDAALDFAADRIDSIRYQGRRYNPTQARKFPRVAEDGALIPISLQSLVGPQLGPVNAEIWDWDSDNNVAIVPTAIFKAAIFEANSILAGDRDAVLNAQRDGLARQTVGSLEEIYFEPGTNNDPTKVLCANAATQVRKYLLTSGRIE